jgi:hypothetical protein
VFLKRHYGFFAISCSDTVLTSARIQTDNFCALGQADACAGAGFHEKGLEVALDIEQLLYEATTLLNAASLICIYITVGGDQALCDFGFPLESRDPAC